MNLSWIPGAALPGNRGRASHRISRPGAGQSLATAQGARSAGRGVVSGTVRILPMYIRRQHLVPFLLGFGVVTFIFEMDVLFDSLDLIINRGVPALAVFPLFGLSLGFVVALSVPCAVLVATLMTFGRLSQDNEITALRASGVHLFRAILPPLLAASGLAVGLTLFNNYVYPDANHAFASLLVDIGRMRPTVKLQ